MSTAHKIADAELPDGWRMVQLDEIATAIMGQSPPGNTVLESNGARDNEAGLPFIQGNAEFGRISPTPTKWCVKPPRVAEDGDVLFSVRAPVGDVNRADRPLCIGRGVAAIRFTAADPAFGWHSINHSRNRFERLAQGSTFEAIGGSEIRALPILLPPLPEQRAIADVLDSIDEAIERTEAVIAATETLRDSLLHELLTRGVPDWHTEWKDVPSIGTIPADWEVVRLGEIIADGPTNGLYKPESDYGDGSPIIRIDDFISGELVNRDRLRRVRVKTEELHRYAVGEGEILINRVNSLSHIGKTVLVPAMDELTLFESNMMKLKLRDIAHPKFGEMVLLTSFARRHFAARAKKAVQQASINQQDVAALPFPLPPKQEQAAIVDAANSVDHQVNQQLAEQDALRSLKESTADALLTGKAQASG